MKLFRTITVLLLLTSAWAHPVQALCQPEKKAKHWYIGQDGERHYYAGEDDNPT